MRLLVVSLLLALGPLFPARQESPSSLNDSELGAYELLFTSSRRGTEEIWRIGADGAGLQRLTDASHMGGQGDLAPAWSSATGLIAFETYRFGGWKVGLMRPDGTGIRRLTANSRAVYEGSPAWSPDGRRVAFMRYRSQQGIWIADADGTGPIWVVDNGADYYRNAQPTWTADGTRLLYVSDASGNYDIWSVGLDGSDPVQITESEHDELAPAMSPDGARILFYSNRGGGYDTYVMDADGTDVVQLTRNQGAPSRLQEGPSGADALNPAWSPDGRYIALVEYRDGQRDIVVTRADGTGRLQVTQHPADDFFPAWVPISTEGN